LGVGNAQIFGLIEGHHGPARITLAQQGLAHEHERSHFGGREPDELGQRRVGIVELTSTEVHARHREEHLDVATVFDPGCSA